MDDLECAASMRIGRVAAELKMRRRRLDAYQRSPDWPGKKPAWRWELAQYDEFLLLAASMFDVAVPEHDALPVPPELRAMVEDRLSQAGLDVWAPRMVRGRLLLTFASNRRGGPIRRRSPR